MKKQLLFIAVAFAFSFTLVNAQTISWKAVPITGVSDVLTQGTLIEALNFSSGLKTNAANFNTTINGVEFKGFVNDLEGDGPASNSFENPASDYFSGTSINVVPTNVDNYKSEDTTILAEFDDLMSRFLWDNTLDTVKLMGLTADKQYKVQLFFGDTRASQAGSYIQIDTAWGDASSTSYVSTLGLSIIGYFIAEDSDVSFLLSKIDGTGTRQGLQLNGYQLREVEGESGISEGAISENLKVYHNSVSQVLNVQLDDLTQEANLAIYSLTGQLVYSGIVSEEKTEIETSSINAGLYLINVSNRNLSYTSKVIIK